MNLVLFVIVLVALQLICLVVGGRASKGLQNQEDYFLASKDVKFFPLMMTFLGTQIGGGLILGSAEEAYQFGWSVLLYPLGACLGFLVLASGIGRKMAQFEVSTVAQLFEVVYRSVRLKKIASLLSIVSLFMILVAQVIASKKFMVSLGFDHTFLFLAFWGVIILYTVMGGLKAVVSIDIVQATFFIAVFLFGFGYVWYANDVTLNSTEQFNFDSTKLTGWLLMPLLFMVIEQDMAQRCFAAQSPRVVTRAATWSAILTLLVCLIPVFLGMLAKNMNLQIAEGSSVFMTVIQAATSPAVAAFVGCAVLMAIISTAISLINAVSSNLTQDFKLSFLDRLSDIQKSRWLTTLIAIGAIIVSFSFTNIVDLLILSYELSVVCLFIPVLFALFNRSGSAFQAGFSIAFGAFGFLFFRLVPVEFPREILSIILSAVGYGIGTLWTVNIFGSNLRPEWKD